MPAWLEALALDLAVYRATILVNRDVITEQVAFSRSELNSMLELAEAGISTIAAAQAALPPLHEPKRVRFEVNCRQVNWT